MDAVSRRCRTATTWKIVRPASVDATFIREPHVQTHAFGVVFLEPGFRGVRGGEYLEVIGVANLLAGVDIGPDGCAHRSSRRPLKKGWRTFPSADLARYSIPARSSGSTQMPLCAIRLV